MESEARAKAELSTLDEAHKTPPPPPPPPPPHSQPGKGYKQAKRDPYPPRTAKAATNGNHRPRPKWKPQVKRRRSLLPLLSLLAPYPMPTTPKQVKRRQSLLPLLSLLARYPMPTTLNPTTQLMSSIQ